ncbi:hypothetical protein QJS66_03930 [Kocuria rhizophila]|nr:hypothetical protein QJS66_03930 [Kocuria rhizophila]
MLEDGAARHPGELQPGHHHDRPRVRDATYVEPITPETVEKIIAKERPDAVLPTLGGRARLNTALTLDANGALEKYGVELVGADVDAHQPGRGPRGVQGRRRALRAPSPRAP